MSPSEQPAASRFVVASTDDVRITVFDALGAQVAQREGPVDTALPHGLYRVQLERAGRITSELVDHSGETELRPRGPALDTPALLARSAAHHEYYAERAERLSIEDTCPPLGPPPHRSRLFVFLRRESREVGPRQLPSEPVTIHDATGRRLATFCSATTRSDVADGYVAFSGPVSAGTYRLRAGRTRRDVAITIPEGRTAHVFIADDGRVRLDDLRVSLRPLGTRFDRSSELADLLETVLAALRVPGRPLPRSARAILARAVEADLCLGVAAAHLLWRARELSAFHELLPILTRHAAALPDVAILGHAARPGTAPVRLSAPPLFRASMILAMATSPEGAGVELDAGGAIAQAARAGFHDSIWCTWSTRTCSERWIEPTVERLREDGNDPIAIARAIGIPEPSVRQTLARVDAAMPSRDGAPYRASELHAPGYELGEVLGRGSQGTVFRATRHDGRAVAWKVVPLRGSPDDRRRMVQQMNGLPRLEHPRVLSPAATGVLPNAAAVWFELELCPGHVLSVMPEATRLPVERACGLVLQALEGLSYLHARGIVHRNLRPCNLLVRSDGSIAIAHLGMFQRLDVEHFAASGCPGTVIPFAPREQLRDMAHTSPASDVWSIAATLYFLLTLDAPRDAYADQSELEAALVNPVVPIVQRWAGVPAPLAQLLDRALSDDPAQRPRDAIQLSEELAAALGAARGVAVAAALIPAV